MYRDICLKFLSGFDKKIWSSKWLSVFCLKIYIENDLFSL